MSHEPSTENHERSVRWARGARSDVAARRGERARYGEAGRPSSPTLLESWWLCFTRTMRCSPPTHAGRVGSSDCDSGKIWHPSSVHSVASYSASSLLEYGKCLTPPSGQTNSQATVGRRAGLTAGVKSGSLCMEGRSARTIPTRPRNGPFPWRNAANGSGVGAALGRTMSDLGAPRVAGHRPLR